MTTEIIDTYDETTGSPALAFLGYIESILTDDTDGMHAFETMFGPNYMGAGAATVVLLNLNQYDRPEYVLLQARQAYSGFTTSPTKRASQRFIDDMLDSLANQQAYHDDEGERVNSFTFRLRIGHTPRIRYLRAVAAVAITLLATFESHAEVPIEQQIFHMREYLLGGGV